VSDILLDIQLTQLLRSAGGLIPLEVAFCVFKGETLAITGASGAGKTTLLKLIAGLNEPLSGKISYNDTVWLDSALKINVKPQNRNLGFVFQDYALFPHFSVRENLRFALTSKEDAWLNELLEAVELTALADRKPFQLSGGQQQRVALVRALVLRPKLLLLDEPLAALDQQMRGKLQEYLGAFKRRFNLTILIVTHDLAEIFGLADRVAVMEEGKIKKLGTPSEVYLQNPGQADKVAVFGQVLSVEPGSEHIRVQVLIRQSVYQLQVPIEKLPELIPGRSFVINYGLDNPSLEFLSFGSE
jgi:molybdate transport system ATP-binding protein